MWQQQTSPAFMWHFDWQPTPAAGGPLLPPPSPPAGRRATSPCSCCFPSNNYSINLLQCNTTFRLLRLFWSTILESKQFKIIWWMCIKCLSENFRFNFPALDLLGNFFYNPTAETEANLIKSSTRSFFLRVRWVCMNPTNQPWSFHLCWIEKKNFVSVS